MKRYLFSALATLVSILSTGALTNQAQAATTADGRVSFNIGHGSLPHIGYISTPNYLGSLYINKNQRAGSYYRFQLVGSHNKSVCVGQADMNYDYNGYNLSLRFLGGKGCTKPYGKVEHFKLYQ